MERREASAGAAGVRWAAALAIVAMAVAGCGASRSAQTSEDAPAISGVDVDAGTLALRDMQVDFGERGFYPAGGQAPLRIWIDNQGDEPVTLEAVTSPDAEAVVLASDAVAETPAEGESTPAPDASATPDADASETPSADASETPSADASATPGGEDASPTADASASASPEGEEAAPELAGERDFTIEIAPDSFVRLAPTRGSFLLLDGLKEEVSMGQTVEVTFVFSNGEAVTVDLPVGTPAVAPSRSYFVPSHEEGAE
ncbi:hypothetical protein [Glycomyces algeriensis]|uniref:Copper chaperone PCu(A)C n=1 Tax=Glycomyces algeriensis TaxID=256037 RepID=A0A9W6GBA1_9ACTN|nr:hypothetical protein [Glycomyces algeriensis]MDA1368841.1 hypothetical protein [Glycomyces algeriensis]MDR7350857.1 copper(I)-binding protein [Glycomyces algeriensis]GLI43568.1 hypothetical protein GALLR39Z86_34180 [Glycomyces algeriensis]